MTNIAMDNGPFIVDLPIENCDFPYIYITWLVIWNMFLFFHNIWDVILHIENSYFSRWLKPPISQLVMKATNLIGK